MADLIRHLEIPFQLEFVKAQSYGQRGTKPAALTLMGFEDFDLTDKHILLVDDIYDSGRTLKAAKQNLLSKHPKTLKTLVLLRKKIPVKEREETPFDYVCFDIEDHFVVGYGLDYKEYFRGLKGIYQLH